MTQNDTEIFDKKEGGNKMNISSFYNQLYININSYNWKQLSDVCCKDLVQNLEIEIKEL